jgi:hypothetical protein
MERFETAIMPRMDHSFLEREMGRYDREYDRACEVIVQNSPLHDFAIVLGERIGIDAEMGTSYAVGLIKTANPDWFSRALLYIRMNPEAASGVAQEFREDPDSFQPAVAAMLKGTVVASWFGSLLRQSTPDDKLPKGLVIGIAATFELFRRLTP